MRRGQGANIGHDRVIAEGPARGEQVGVPNRERVSAFDPASGELVWQSDFPTPTAISSSGNLVTAGNVLFQGSESGQFYAFDAKTGRQLLAFKAPRAIRASPLTYKVNGRQYVTFVASSSVVALGLP